MIAPVEVWVKIGSPYKAYSVTLQGTVRYLRADLTCGECRWWENINHDCPRQASLDHTHNEPACMAFVPKEEK